MIKRTILAWTLMLINYSADAQLTVYTLEANFTSAAQAVGTLKLTDDLDAYSSQSWPITLNDLSVAGGSVAFPNSNANTSVDGSPYMRFVNVNGIVTFNFNDPVIAFGFDTNPQGGSGVGDTFDISAGGDSSSYSMPETDVTEFRGFVADTSFTTFTIDFSGGDSFYGIDNLVTYTPVPEPETTTSFMGGLLFAFALLIRNRDPKPKT